MAELEACLRHGQIKVEKGWVKTSLKGQDLDLCLQFLGLTIRDCTCPDCWGELNRYMNYPTEEG